MSKILINKIKSNDAITNIQQDINIKLLTDNFIKKIDNSITELVSKDTTLYFEKENDITNENKINEFLVEYDNIKILMTKEQLYNFYKLVESDVAPELINDIIKTSILDIKDSQGVLITNKNYKINNRQIPYLNRNKFDEPFTITTWIKPNSKNFSRKTLIRNQLIFTIEGEIIKR